MATDDDDRERDERARAAEHLKQGLGLLFQAAREAATGVKKELDKTAWSKTIDDAGRELVRATANVVERVGSELSKEIERVRRPNEKAATPPPPAAETRGADPPPGEGRGAEPPPAEARAPEPPPIDAEDDEPKGGEPGFRIVIDDEPPKDRGDKGG